jgi:hypothetical protein
VTVDKCHIIVIGESLGIYPADPLNEQGSNLMNRAAIFGKERIPAKQLSSLLLEN